MSRCIIGPSGVISPQSDSSSRQSTYTQRLMLVPCMYLAVIGFNTVSNKGLRTTHHENVAGRYHVGKHILGNEPIHRCGHVATMGDVNSDSIKARANPPPEEETNSSRTAHGRFCTSSCWLTWAPVNASPQGTHEPGGIASSIMPRADGIGSADRGCTLYPCQCPPRPARYRRVMALIPGDSIGE